MTDGAVWLGMTIERVWARLARVVETRRAPIVCFASALVVFGIESLAWPLSNGRDSTTYLMYYADMWHAHPAYPALMLYRTPLAPVVYGSLLQLGGPLLAEAGMGLLFALSVVAFTTAALEFGPMVGLLTAVALLVLPGYGALFHQVSSDPIFAFVFSLWTLVTIRALRAPQWRRFVWAGVLLLVLVLARPGSQVLLLFAAAPLLLRVDWRKRLFWASSFVAMAGILLAFWAGYNDARYGSFVIARVGWADVPFYRVFVMDKFVRTDNGPASRDLAAVVQRDLLTKPAYRKLGISTPDQFFEVASDRMWSDIVVVVDRTWGWHSDYAILRRVSLEAIRPNLHLYAHDVALAVWDELRNPYTWSAPQPSAAPGAASTGSAAPAGGLDVANVGGVYWWLASTPDGTPPVASRVARLNREVDKLQNDLPERAGSRSLASFLNGISNLYPWLALWLAVGLLAVVLRRPKGAYAVTVTAALALAVIVETELGNPPGLEYVLPFAPALILCALAALLSPSSSHRGLRLPARRRPAP